jgi:hypothetical protein
MKRPNNRKACHVQFFCGRVMMLIRAIAAVLAIGGAFWGVALAGLFNSEGDPGRVLIFCLTAGPGYLITLGYLLRAVWYPPLPVSVVIWMSSIVVQGTWLMIGLSDGKLSLFLLWWLGAFLASGVALWLEFRQDILNGIGPSAVR